MTPNSLAFIALSNEYCQALETVLSQSSPNAFVAEMLRLLPRLYLTASDLRPDALLSPDDTPYLDSYLDEDVYEHVRESVASLLGSDDVYLEVFDEDMQFSDTPIRANVSESLADIYQVLYNFISTVREAPEDVINEALHAVREDFASYWSQRVVNVMRPLNQLRYSASPDDDTDDDPRTTGGHDPDESRFDLYDE